MVEAARRLLPDYGVPKSALQRMAEDAINNARFHRYAETMAARAAAAASPLDLTRELLRSFEPPKSSLQRMIDAAQATVARGTIAEVFAASQAARLDLGAIPDSVRRAVADERVWRSVRTGDFFARLARDSAFRGAILEEFDAEESDAAPVASAVPMQTVLEAVESGLAEAVVNPQARSVQDSVRSMFAVWRKLPEELRSLVINVIAGIITAYLCLYLLPLPTADPSTTSAPQEQVRIAQKVIQNVIVIQGLGPDAHKHLRVVKRHGAPVHRSKRRASPKLTTLPRAKPVAVVARQRHWTKVSWSENEGRGTQVGWVHTQHLKKVGPR